MVKVLTEILLMSGFTIKAHPLYDFPENTTSHASSFENMNGIKGNGGKTNRTAKGNAFEMLKPGESKTLLDITAQGLIQRM